MIPVHVILPYLVKSLSVTSLSIDIGFSIQCNLKFKDQHILVLNGFLEHNTPKGNGHFVGTSSVRRWYRRRKLNATRLGAASRFLGVYLYMICCDCLWQLDGDVQQCWISDLKTQFSLWMGSLTPSNVTRDPSSCTFPLLKKTLSLLFLQ